MPCNLLLTHKTVLQFLVYDASLALALPTCLAFYTASYDRTGHHRFFIRQRRANAVVGAVQEAVTEAHEHVAYIDRDRPRQGVHARPVPPRQSPRPSAVQPVCILAGGVVGRVRICVLPREDFQSRLA
jgi:hypothetical protein